MINAAIAAGHEATAATAAEILKAGGNAFDAAIAALMTTFIAEPCMSSAGAGAFANVFTANGEALLFDFFCQTPSRKRPVSEVDFYPIEVDFGDTREVFHIGRGSSAVPGMIAGIFALHKRFATLPLSVLAQPAIQQAKEGVPVNAFQYFDLSLLESILRVAPEATPIFFAKGPLAAVGEPIRMPGLADFLDHLAREGRAAFYQGEIAQKIVRNYRENGGYLTMDDFRNYEVIVRQPLHFRHGTSHILTNPLPSTGGSLLALACAFSPSPEKGQSPYGLRHLQQLQQVFEQVDHLGKRPRELAQHLRRFYQHSPKGLQLLPEHNKKWGSTSHFNIVDRHGNAISLSMTIGEGCGYFIEGTDMQMNNMLGEAALLPDGFHSWTLNTRLSSMMTPTIILDAEEQVDMVMGSGGASRIPSAIFQVLHYLRSYGLSVEEAVEAARVHLEHGVFNVEQGFEASMAETPIGQELREWSGRSMFFGGVHTIAKERGRYRAAGDSRRDGVGVEGEP